MTANNNKFEFWSTQPVKKFSESVGIDQQIKTFDINNTETELPKEFKWDVITDYSELTGFLNKYYVEDSKNQFRLNYQNKMMEFIYNNTTNVLLCVRLVTNNVIVATICGKVVKTQINKNKVDNVEINFLCVHPKLRNKKLTPVLVSEIQRRFTLLGFQEGMFVSRNIIPTPVITAKYYHKIINPKVLVETGFIRLDQSTNLKNVKNSHKMPDNFYNKNFKKATENHIDQMFDLFQQYMSKYNMHPIYTIDEFKNHFMNENVTCYVIEKDNKVVDFISYITMQTEVLQNNSKYKFIRRAYLYYYTATNETLYSLLKDMLIVARNSSIDVFDALDIMENTSALTDLGFDEGTGISNYYLYNRKIKNIKNIQCAKVFF